MKAQILSLSAALLTTASVMAVPAAPGMMERRQPDGTKVCFELRGDEYLSWGVTPDGYTLLPDREGYWTVATLDKKGELAASRIRYKGNSAASLAEGISPGLKFNLSQTHRLKKERIMQSRRNSPGLQLGGTFPTTGKRKMLMVLVTFSDRTPVKTREDFDNYMNQPGYNGIGSFRDFYLENSYGQLDITTTVTEWIKLPHAHSYYGTDGAEMIVEYVVNYLHNNGIVNLSDYDNDGDGLLDGLAIIHQGPGQEATGDSRDIWSHTGYPGGITAGGVSVGNYTIQPEVLGNTDRQSTIGVMCHEFGHNLGSPDFYDTDYAVGGEFPGTSCWDLMASGSWNGDYGDRPAHINMWQKIQFGWLEPTVLTGEMKVKDLPDAAFNPVCYKLDTTEEGDYFIIENRQHKSVFDSALPEKGMVIYHANEEGIGATVWGNAVNARFPQYMYVVSATAETDPDNYPYSYGNYDPFPSDSMNSFDDNTIPSATSVNGYMSYSGIYDITANNDGTIAFEFRQNEAPAAPTGLTARADQGVVTLHWEYGDDAEVDHYAVSRDDELIAETKEKSYEDRKANADETYIYKVRAVLKSGKQSPFDKTFIIVPVNNVLQIRAKASAENGLTLDWDLTKGLSYMRGVVGRLLLAVSVQSMEYAHRFRVENMALYDGYTIESMQFMPCMDYMGNATFTLRVWEAQPGGSDARIVAEQKVNGSTLGEAPVVKFDNKAVIHAGHELWYSVLVETTDDKIYFYVNPSKLTEGLGNLMRYGDSEWMSDIQPYGDFIITSQLSAPETNHTVMLPVSDNFDSFDPQLDLMCPVGFAVYRDGEYIGSTSSRCFIDKGYDMAKHTYGVASLYRNGNISKPRPIEVSGNGGVEIVVSGETMAEVTVADGTINISGWTGQVVVSHISGMTVYSTDHHDGRPIAVNPGIYVVRAGKHVGKVIIR